MLAIYNNGAVIECFHNFFHIRIIYKSFIKIDFSININALQDTNFNFFYQSSCVASTEFVLSQILLWENPIPFIQ